MMIWWVFLALCICVFVYLCICVLCICVFYIWYTGMSYSISLNPMLLKNIAHVWSLKHFAHVGSFHFHFHFRIWRIWKIWKVGWNSEKKHSGFGSGRKKKSGSGRVAVTCQGLPISNFFLNVSCINTPNPMRPTSNQEAKRTQIRKLKIQFCWNQTSITLSVFFLGFQLSQIEIPPDFHLISIFALQ